MTIIITYRRMRRISMRVVSNGDVHVTAPLLTPKKTVMRFVRDNEAWIEETRRKVLDAGMKRYNFYAQLPLETKEQVREAVSRLDALITPMLQKYTAQMRVQPSKIVYKPTISRWGSCSRKTGVICFSTYLLLLPEFCVEHVVVHELAHLIEANHGPKFHALMDCYFPRWKEARKVTRMTMNGR